jgi:hypothetical protein
MEDIQHIAIIKKCLKKLPAKGMVEREEWFQFKYRVTGIKFNDDKYSWNRVLYVNIEVSDKYWSTIQGWVTSKNYFWSSRRRNQYIRSFVKDDVRPFFDVFSLPYKIQIGTIKMID